MAKCLHSLQQKLDRAILKRDKWAARVEKLHAKLTTPGRSIPLLEAQLKRFRPHDRYQGVPSLVAKECGDTALRVMRVARGFERDTKIEIALFAELDRCDAGVFRHDSKKINALFDEATMRAFQRGGRYFGLPSEVARALGVTPSFPARVAAGQVCSDRVACALKAAMAKRDEQWQTNGGAK